jgi:integrase
MAVYKRGNTYWFEFTFESRRVRESAKTGNKRIAEQIEAAKKTQLAKREVGLDVEKPIILTLPEAVKQFFERSNTEHTAKQSTSNRYAVASKPLLKFFGNKAINDITSDDVDKYKAWRSVQKKKAPSRMLKKNKNASSNKTLMPATVNKELATLKIILNHFIIVKVLQTNPVCKVKFLKEDNNNYVVLSPEEEKLYLMAASLPLQDFAVLMLECGCRPSELYNLQKKDIDLDQSFIMIQEGKTKAARRRIPLTERAIRVVRKRIQDSSGDYLFSGGRGGNSKTHSIVKLNNAHYGARERSDVRKFRIYDLRHTFASRMAMAGVDLVTLAALLGHSRIEMVLRYAHPVEEHKIDAMRKLELFNQNKKQVA